MESKKQTAVEWLEKQIGSKIADANIRISYPNFCELINKAKQMEKEQIRKAYNRGFDDGIDHIELGTIHDSEQYYNETFGKDDTTTN